MARSADETVILLPEVGEKCTGPAVVKEFDSRWTQLFCVPGFDFSLETTASSCFSHASFLRICALN